MPKTVVRAVGAAIFFILSPLAHAQGQVGESQSVGWGITLTNRDLTVRPQDDFYSYTNGSWLKKTAIPADKSAWGSFNELHETTANQLNWLIDHLKQTPVQRLGAQERKLLNLYRDFMNESALNQLGAQPLATIFLKIDRLTNKEQIPALIAYLDSIGVSTPYGLEIHQDAKDSTKVVADIYQGGLGLPDRDYYLKANESGMAKTLAQYQQHIKKMLSLANVSANPAQAAENIVELETHLAEVQWSKVANRDPLKTYNNYPIARLADLAPNYPWNTYLQAAGLNKVRYLIVSQPSYIRGFNQRLALTPLNVWQDYFKWQVLSRFSPYLSSALLNENFAFYGTILRGIPQNQPRWKRGLELLEATMGEALGKLYVTEYFPAQNKHKMARLIANLLEAYRQSIASLDWMSRSSKLQAQAKLQAMMLKIAYPDHWRDYSALLIKPGDLVANVIRANQFEYQRNINKLGHPVDRSEWGMTPQTVNAYYNPEMNEIVFPAAILQAPFFDVKADDAVNYGGIGAVIGHEISHAFDDQGSQYDAQGNLRDWLTPVDHARFKQKTRLLVAQYGAYSPLPGYLVNGELTLGENIADNSGLSIAYKAYQLSLHGHPAVVLSGFSGTQRLYLSWASVWRAKIRQAQQVVLLKSDPHAPAAIRGNATLRNQPGFYSAFGVKPGDKMYLNPAQRVSIW